MVGKRNKFRTSMNLFHGVKSVIDGFGCSFSNPSCPGGKVKSDVYA